MWTIIAVVFYLMLIGYLGFLGYRKTTNASDYLIAGRQIHPYVMAISYGATFISTSAIVGFGGAAGVFGMGLLWLTFCNILVGIFIAFVVFGNRTRVMGYILDAHTFPEFMGKRYDSRFIQVFSGAIIFIAMPLYAGVVMIGGVKFIEIYMGVPYDAALAICAVIIAAYVIAGGLKGVMYTDAAQGTIMFVGMSILFIYTYVSLGGFTAAHQALTDLADKVPEKLAAAGHMGWTSMPKFLSNWWWTLVSTIVLGVGIGVLAQPQLVVRFMTVKSKRELNRAVFAGGIFIFMMTGVAFIVGSLSNVFFFRSQGTISIAAAGGNADAIIPLFISEALPKWFGVLFLLTLLSAAMSTLSSQFHTMGTAISRDIFQQLTPKAKKDNTLIIARLGVLLGIITIVILGKTLPDSIIAPGTAIFFGLCASSFLPMYALGLYWKRVTPTGAKSGLVVGFLGSVFYLLFIHAKESAALGACQALFGKPNLVPSLAVVDPIIIVLPISLLVTVLVSMFTRPMTSQQLEKIFRR